MYLYFTHKADNRQAGPQSAKPLDKQQNSTGLLGLLSGASVQNLDRNKRTVSRFECRKEGWRRLTAISAFMSFFVQLAEEKAKESIRDRIDSLAPFFSAELLQNPACRQFCAEISPRTS